MRELKDMKKSEEELKKNNKNKNAHKREKELLTQD